MHTNKGIFTNKFEWTIIEHEPIQPKTENPMIATSGVAQRPFTGDRAHPYYTVVGTLNPMVHIPSINYNYSTTGTTKQLQPPEPPKTLHQALIRTDINNAYGPEGPYHKYHILIYFHNLYKTNEFTINTPYTKEHLLKQIKHHVRKTFIKEMMFLTQALKETTKQTQTRQIEL